MLTWLDPSLKVISEPDSLWGHPQTKSGQIFGLPGNLTMPGSQLKAAGNLEDYVDVFRFTSEFGLHSLSKHD